jgi:carboxyl-terminal processing protease
VIAEATPDVGTWSTLVWHSALEGDMAGLQDALKKVPDAAGLDEAERFRASYAQHLTNSRRADTARIEALGGAEERLAQHLDEDDISQALRAAVEVQALSVNLNDALQNRSVEKIIDRATAALPEIEAERDWLHAQELLYRLRTLYEDTWQDDLYQRYDDELERVNQRVALLARYAPRRLHELRQQAAERAEEEPLEPFNPALIEDWRDRIDGVNDFMIRRALETAAYEHIEQLGWRPLLRGGLDSLLTFATTPSLEETFPRLADAALLNLWVEELEQQMIVLERADDDELSKWYLSRLLRELQRRNTETVSLPEEVIYREFGEGATNELDQFSEVIWPNRLRRFQQATDGNFVGVGILIRHNEKREIMVVNPLEGTPAYYAGVKPDDLIVEVDGEATVGWSLNDAVDRITGPKGKEVMLGLRRRGEEDVVRIPIERDVIKLHTVMGWWKKGLADDGDPQWDWFIDPASRIAYVRLTQFTDDTYRDLLRAWREMTEVGRPTGLILDLRYNPGGLLTSAVNISNLFVEQGVIVSGEDKNGNRAWPDLRAQPRLAALDGVPTVVLVNKGSASASEIVSGCLQAYNAAVIVGERSFGKGSVQTVHPITESSRLKLTTQYYRLPSGEGPPNKGRLVHKRPGSKVWGVDPDILVPMTPDQIEASIELRRTADLIPDDGTGQPDPDSPDRPAISRLLTEGIDPQLETALLILQARALSDIEARHARAN